MITLVSGRRLGIGLLAAVLCLGLFGCNSERDKGVNSGLDKPKPVSVK